MAQVPSKVTLSRANTPTADGFSVAWSDLSNETAYHLEHTTSANFTNSTLITNISANSTSHALTGLTPGTTYYVRVRGAAAGGNGTWSDVQANQLLSVDPGQTRYLSVPGIPHGASHSVNFTVSDVFGSANAAGLAAGSTSSQATTVMLLGSDGSTAHTIFYNSSQNEWREGDTNKGTEVVGFGKGFMVRNNTSTADIFLLSGAVPPLESGAVTVFAADAPAGRLSLVTPSRTMPTSLRSLGLTYSNNTTTGLKRATAAKDADLLLIPDSAGGMRRFHFDGTNWRSGLRTVSDPSSVTIPAGGAFFLRKASGSSFEQWRPPSDIVTDGLILHLDAGNPASYPGTGTTWTDLSGNGYNGTLTNGPSFNSSNEGSLVFDGVNDFVSMDNKNPAFINSTFPNGLTIGFTIRLTDPFPATGDGRTIITRNSGAAGTNAFNLSIQANRKLRFWLNLSASHPFSSTTLNTNQIYVCTLTWNRSHAKYYLQGVLDSTTAYSPTPTVSNHSRFNIGFWGDAGWEFPGNIYNILFYDRVLSDQEIQQNFNALKERYGLGNKLLLDIEPAAAAYALRKLRAEYAGNCIRVRRASDNTTQNIGFVGNDLDVAALESFCSGTNGFVDIWYDQSGNGYNLAQTNLGSQPQIVSSGTVLYQSGKPTMEWDGVNGGNGALLYFPSTANGVFQNKTYGEIAFCGRNTVTNARRDVAAFQTNTNGFSRIAPFFGSVTVNRLTSGGRRLDGDSYTSATSSNNSTNSFAQFAIVRNWNNAEARAIENNVTVANSAAGTAGSTSNTASVTGVATSNTSGVGRVFETTPIKNISEVIFYNTDVSATQSRRHGEMMNYYGL